MTTNTREDGTSVYCTMNFEEKSANPLYQAIRHWIREESSRTILDLGCSDLPATTELALEGKKVIGVDMCESALLLAQQHAPQAMLYMADINKLPTEIFNCDIDMVLLLDVLEHLERPESISLLRQLHSNLGKEFFVAVSMPVISVFSLPCIYEAISMAKKGRRPETGLFDRTHKILTNQNGHRSIFTEAGYDILREGYTSPQGVVGIDFPEKKNAIMGKRRTGIQRLLIQRIIPKVVGAMSGTDTSVVIKTLTAYQGLYLLKPNS